MALYYTLFMVQAWPMLCAELWPSLMYAKMLIDSLSVEMLVENCAKGANMPRALMWANQFILTTVQAFSKYNWCIFHFYGKLKSDSFSLLVVSIFKKALFPVVLKQ